MAPGEQRWCLRLAWDGTAYVGWQRQPNGLSIQEAVEEAVARLSGARRPVSASGRTDAGVHAHAQVVALDLPEGWSPERVRGGLNHHLPADISCLSAEPAHPDFDPRRWVRWKRYRYRILRRSARCPFRAGHTWHQRRSLDEEAMRAASAILVGRHDFESFRASRCSAAHAVRTLEAARVCSEGDELHLDFVGNGFVRHQVRIFVGSLVEVGLGRWSVAELERVLAARDRSAAGPTAPPRGLWLMEVALSDRPYWSKDTLPHEEAP